MEAAEQPSTRKKSTLREFVETLLLTLLIYVVVRSFLFENYRVVGRSMIPTLEDNQFLAVNKLGYRLHNPQRGDIIVFRDPRDQSRKLIKRVIGLPGDVVEVSDGQVYIDEQALAEDYISAPGRYSYPSTRVPESEYFVLGDNRNNSSDSHNWGMLSKDLIVGKAWVSYWPPNLWGVLPAASYEGAAP
jgi:signal peptidase I